MQDKLERLGVLPAGQEVKEVIRHMYKTIDVILDNQQFILKGILKHQVKYKESEIDKDIQSRIENIEGYLNK